MKKEIRKEICREISNIPFIASIIFTFINGDLVNVNKARNVKNWIIHTMSFSGEVYSGGIEWDNELLVMRKTYILLNSS